MKDEKTAFWMERINPGFFDTRGNPDKYAQCTNCNFIWTDLYSVKNYFKHCPNCGRKLTYKPLQMETFSKDEVVL